eukprot:XP_017951952.1 PREDICTED: vomeronasal type-2 receptor 26-like [Xenopus tropicalis]
MTRSVQRWTDQSDSTLRHCFNITDWEVFRTAADNNINNYAEYVTDFIHKCINDVVPRVNVRTYPNQKPWVNGEVCAALRARTAAFKSGDPSEYKSSRPTFQHLTHLLAFMYAIEEINNSTELLPNITLGYRIYDACNSDVIALMSTFSLLSEDENPTVNYIYQPDQKLVAFVGHLLSSTTYTIAEITQLYGYPQISYGALDPTFNDRIHFPSVYRTVPNEYSQFRVIIKLLKHFGWTWVGIITSVDDSNHQASEELQKEMGRNGICVEFVKSIANNPMFSSVSAIKAVKAIEQSSVRVIILYFRINALLQLLNWIFDIQTAERVYICSVTLDIVIEEFMKPFYIMNGSLLIALPRGDIPGLNDFISYKLWTDLSENIFLQTVFYLIAECSVDLDGVKNVTCLKKHRIKEHLLQEETITHRIKHTIYMAVYALAHALDNMQLPGELRSAKEMSKIRFKLNYYLKNLHLKMASGEDFFFTSDGNILGKFDILNWIINKNETINKIHVGRFLPNGDHFIINETVIAWTPYFEMNRVLLASERAHQNGRPPCCFDCVSCSEGEISNATDVETCVKCAEAQWPNPAKDQCILRIIDFLSYQDILGHILSGCALVFIVLTAAVFLVFIKHRRTPIVRANNQNISYILLMALLMSFLCSFIFIGQPTGVTCMLRQTTVLLVLSIAISSILGKTTMVLAAFKATKMERTFRKWGRINISVVVVFLCSFGELVICVIWLSLYPPHVESDKTIPGKLVLQCNEGSIISFYLAVSYIGVLSLISFAVAFIARKLPDRFNEAQHITFSMLVFCSVWVSFIPTYLSTKGKHMVAVEIFAIQASAAGLLMCIFTPKCYIILLKPELNVKGKPTAKIQLHIENHIPHF